jgi:hypothetical protein
VVSLPVYVNMSHVRFVGCSFGCGGGRGRGAGAFGEVLERPSHSILYVIK